MYIRGVTNTLICGTSRGEIYVVENYDTAPKPRCVFKGHFDGELWGLAVHPRQPNLFVTAGEDNRVILWDANEHKAVGFAPINPQPGKKVRRVANGASTLSSCMLCFSFGVVVAAAVVYVCCFFLL